MPAPFKVLRPLFPVFVPHTDERHRIDPAAKRDRINLQIDPVASLHSAGLLDVHGR